MAKSSSSAVPGDVEWLPGPGGSRVLRIHPASPEPPALILRTAGGAEVRLEARPGPATEYDIPGELDWSTAWLQWPDGTRATVPAPHGPHAQVIELRPRRERAAGGDASTVGAIAAGSEAASEAAARDEAPAAGATAEARGTTSVGEAAARDETPAAGATTTPPADAAAHWTTPPRASAPAGADAEALWRSRTADLGRELADAAAAIARAREGERSARDAVLAALAAARADLRASRAARAADASTLAAVTGELDAERSAHAVTRGSVGTLADALATARTELAAARSTGDNALAGARAEAASLREALESERAARAAAEALLRESVEARSAAEAALREAESQGARRAAEGRAIADAARRSAEGDSTTEAARRDAEARTASEAGADATAADPVAASLDVDASRTPAADPGDRVSLMDRVADLNRQAAGLRDQSALERRAREQAEAAAAVAPRAREESAKLLANLDAAAAALRASAAPPVDEPPEREQAKRSTALVAPGENARLRHALVAFAREDPMAAGALLVGLAPAQGAVLEGSLSYDLTVRGVGTFAVTVEDGSARVVRLPRKRPRGEARFHLSGEPVALAELLAGDRHKVGRLRRKARLTGDRKRGQELLALPEARISLAQAARAGARLEPASVYRALPFAIDPEWTRGHNFTVAQQIVELAPQAWHITVRDGQPVRVVERNSGAQADATVTMSRAAFDRLLRAERPVHGDHPVVRGDREAVAALKRWTERLT